MNRPQIGNSVYGGIGVAQSVFALLTAYALAIGSIHASKTLHKQLLYNIHKQVIVGLQLLIITVSMSLLVMIQ